MSLATAVAAAVKTAKRIAGVTVVYRRGADSVVLEKAIKTNVSVPIQRDGGLTTEVERTDWIIQADELVLNETEIEPAEGDQLDQIGGSKTLTYEAMPIGTERCFKPLDPHGTAWRVHTKLIKVV